MGLILQGLVGFLVLVVGFVLFNKFKVQEVPQYPDTWWGKGDPSKEDTTIRPFKIDIPNEVIDDLNIRLARTLPLQPALEGVQQNYGMNSQLLESIIAYWKESYNWTERQQFLNKYPQYTVSVQGLKIHYIHVKPTVNKQAKLKVVPLLLLHGWPGSVREFYEIIPLLTEPQKERSVVFEIIAPSLPGYGFSEATTKPGLSPIRVAQVMKNLMHRIGFEKFYVQGGDWGALILSYMSVLYPESLLGAHSNMCICEMTSCNLKLWLLGSTFPSLIAEKEELSYLIPIGEQFTNFLLLETGYLHIQATKPDTIGTALRDSPAGLAAYILEKFTSWTNAEWKNLEDGGLTKRFTLDKLLDNVMIYWVSRSITTSQRLYAEHFNKKVFTSGIDNLPSKVPTGCAMFKNELTVQPKSLLRMKYSKLIQANYYPDGGHFPALELPDVLAKDIYDFVEKIEEK